MRSINFIEKNSESVVKFIFIYKIACFVLGLIVAIVILTATIGHATSSSFSTKQGFDEIAAENEAAMNESKQKFNEMAAENETAMNEIKENIEASREHGEEIKSKVYSIQQTVDEAKAKQIQSANDNPNIL